jgi:DNA-binding winged helix-turn-helix (wHTH) protein
MSGKTYAWDERLIAARRAFKVLWEERRRPLGDGAPGEKPVPVALAAYLLGRGGNVCRLERRMAQDAGEPAGECPGGLLRTVRELEKVLESLKGLIRDRRYETLRRILSRCHAAGEVPAPDGPAPEGPVVTFPERLPDDLTWQRFLWLATGALPQDTGLAVLAGLGAVVGGVEFGLYVRGGDPEEGQDRADEDPLIRALIHAATALPWECTRDIAPLAVAKRLAPQVTPARSGDWLAEMKQLVPTRKVVNLDVNSPCVDVRCGDQVFEIDYSIQESVVRITSARDGDMWMKRVIPPQDSSPSAEEGARGRPGYLGIWLVQKDREVWRHGYTDPVRFGGKSRLWDLLKVFILSHGVTLSKGKLYKQVWAPANLGPEDSTIYWAIHKLNKKVAPLENWIENWKGEGYRLVDESVASRGPRGNSTGRRVGRRIRTPRN